MKQTKVPPVKLLASITHHMRTNVLLGICILQTVLGLSVQAQGSSFTYQGRLDTNGLPLNGAVGLRPTLWDASSGGTLVAGNSPTDFLVSLTNGLFTAPLNFGGAAFTGQPRWLQWEVSHSGGPFTTLTPRQPVTPTPYAMIAGNVSGVIANASLPASPSFSGTVSAGGFTGSGTGLTNLNASQLTTGTLPLARLPASVTQLGQSIESAEITDGTIQAGDLDGPSFNEFFWGVAGNTLGGASGTPFLGTRDNAPLEFRVNNQRTLRLEPNAANAPNIIGGYAGNYVSNTVVGATISGGGVGNWPGGPYVNRVLADFGTVGGGSLNTASGYGAIISGGVYNTASGEQSAVAGGYFNQASGYGAFVGGGEENFATGFYATIPGGLLNSATNYAFAAGRAAKAVHPGAFVWSDSTVGFFASTAADQFAIRASGGVRLSDSTPSISFGATTRQMLDLYNQDYGVGVQVSTLYQRSNSRFSWFRGGVHSNTQNDPGAGGVVAMTLTSGGLTVNGTFVSASDRNVKEDFQPVDPQAVLAKVVALPLSEWRYKDDEERSRHLGPVAQDFHAAFGLGPDDKHIATVDADGVALAAIQGLNQKLEGTRAENAALKQRLAQLEEVVRALAARGNGGRQ
ncbi:MAG TPA: tail fiber domain-containing protein [Verrucomicrobiae bacterium]